VSFEPLKTGRRFFLLVLSALVVAPYRALAKRLAKGPLVYLTWRVDPTTTVVVNWMDGDARSNDYVLYRHMAAPTGSRWMLARGFKHLFADQKKRIVHHVELRGLQPDTEYIFTVRSQGPVRGGRYFKFRTLPRTLPANFRFVTGGDMMHKRKYLDVMNQRAAQLNPWFALLGGDLAYANASSKEVAKWDDWLESWILNSVRKSDGCLIPMVVAIGNHEVAGGTGKKPKAAKYFYSLFPLPVKRSFYAMDFGDYLSLIVLDSDLTERVEGEQTVWLGQALAKRAGKVPLIFPCYHKPAYGTAKPPKDTNDSSKDPLAQMIIKNWCPLFDKYLVTAVFENDHHTYKRTHRLRGNKVDEKNGILYLGDGCWGVDTRAVPKPGKLWYLAKAASKRHLICVTIQNGKPSYVAYEADGKVIDQYG
jgi:hypothetical protein